MYPYDSSFSFLFSPVGQLILVYDSIKSFDSSIDRSIGRAILKRKDMHII